MEENVTQIKSRITLNANVSVKILKNIMCAKKIRLGILLHILVKTVWRFSDYVWLNYKKYKKYSKKFKQKFYLPFY